MAKLEVYTTDTFAEKMDAFIIFCESESIDATDYQLIRFFGITPTALESYRSSQKQDGTDADQEAFAGALKKLDLYREDATIRQVVTDPKLSSHCAFKLRQPHWGGWNDKPELTQELSVRVNIGDGTSDLLE